MWSFNMTVWVLLVLLCLKEVSVCVKTCKSHDCSKLWLCLFKSVLVRWSVCCEAAWRAFWWKVSSWHHEKQDEITASCREHLISPAVIIASSFSLLLFASGWRTAEDVHVLFRAPCVNYRSFQRLNTVLVLECCCHLSGKKVKPNFSKWSNTNMEEHLNVNFPILCFQPHRVFLLGLSND